MKKYNFEKLLIKSKKEKSPSSNLSQKEKNYSIFIQHSHIIFVQNKKEIRVTEKK